MKFLFDYTAIILFFIFYKFYGIYVATTVSIVVACICLAIIWMKYKKIEFMQIVPLATILLLGGATLLLHNDLFVKWKPTVVSWALGSIFLISKFFFKKNCIYQILKKQMELPQKNADCLNYMWIAFFFVLGGINLFFVYKTSTDTWVNFKLFGILGITLLFGVLQSFYIMKFLKQNN